MKGTSPGCALAAAGVLAVTTATGAAAQPGTIRGATPAIQWTTCPDFDGTPPSPSLECGTLSVPLNYANPNGDSIDIAVSRMKARKAAQRHGTLFLNPGGPGGPGLDMPIWFGQLLPQSVLDRYDLVGFDPRGVSRSAPVSCGLTAEQSYDVAPPIEQAGSFDATAAFMAQVATGCGQLAGAQLPYLTTANTARDMDRIRQALGEATISYFGISYGTYLGAVYASLFPDRTDRFVIDSSTDPFADWRETFRRFSLAEASRFPDLGQFIADNNADYGLGATQAEVRASYFRLYAKVDQHPIPLPDLGVTMNGPWFRVLTFAGLYSDADFASTARLWQLVDTDQPAGAITPVARELAPRTAAFPGVPADNSGVSTLAVLCDDSGWPTSVEQYRQELAADTAQYPMFGPVASGIWACAFWPNQPAEPPVVIGPTGPRDILMIQNTRDPATPYAGAQQMRAALGQRAAFLTVEQGGHGSSYFAANECARQSATDYLVDGALPATDLSCPAEASPAPLTAQQRAAARAIRQRMW